jgi:glycosyltransferase involved in cell wall biosynthesis
VTTDAAPTTHTPTTQAPVGEAAAAPIFSVVVPMFNEADGILLLHSRLTVVMDGLGEAWEVVYVNDGSRDTTLLVVEDLRGRDRHVAMVNLSRNFGKEIATTAALITRAVPP